MDKATRLELAKNFLAQMTEAILEDVAKMPDEFDGFEVRAYCFKAFEAEDSLLKVNTSLRARQKAFTNWRVTAQVKY